MTFVKPKVNDPSQNKDLNFQSSICCTKVMVMQAPSTGEIDLGPKLIKYPVTHIADNAALVAAPAFGLLPRKIEALIDEDNWHDDSGSRGFQEYVAVRQSLPLTIEDQTLRSLSGASESSFMAVALSSLANSEFGSWRSSKPPSLASFSTRWSDTTVRTSEADPVIKPGLLPEDEYGILGAPFPAAPQSAELKCIFEPLRCDYTSNDVEEWRIHCTSHFRGQKLPRRVLCGVCEWSHSVATGDDAWTARLEHLIDCHRYQHGLQYHIRRDELLYEHLFNVRLISNAQYQALVRHGCLDGSEAPFVMTQGLSADRRREGRGPRSVFKDDRRGNGLS